MTREELHEEVAQHQKECQTKLDSVYVEVAYSGVKGFEYNNCTEEDAKRWAVEDFYSEKLSSRDVSIDECEVSK